MNQILKEIKQINNWKNLYDSFAVKNNLNSINSKVVSQENFENFQNFIETIVQKGPRKSKKRWVSNQRRIFHTILNCISVISMTAVEKFKNEEIQRLTRVFQYKDKHSIEYELLKLNSNNKQGRRRWSEKEQNLLQDVVRKSINKNKWNEIARQLFIASKGQYFRQGKHCRERFYKLKSSKGSEQKSQEILDSPQIQNQKSFKFHSIDSRNGQDQKDIKGNFNINIKLEYFDCGDKNKSLIYNQNHQDFNIKSQLTKKCEQKSKENLKTHESSIKTSDCIEKEPKNQQSNILNFSQNMFQQNYEAEDSQQRFSSDKDKKSNLNNAHTFEVQSMQNRGGQNIKGNENIFPSTSQTIHVNNLLTPNVYIHHNFPIAYTIWPISVYPLEHTRQQ